MDYAIITKRQEKAKILLKIVRWAQKKRKIVENLTKNDVREAIRYKF